MGGIWGSLRCLAPSKSDKKSQREASKSVITEARLGTGKLSTVSTKDHPELWSRSALWISGMKAKVQRPEDQVQTRKQTWVQPCLASQPPQHTANSVLYTYYYNNWKIFYFYICVCVLWLYARIWRTEEAVRSPVVGVTGSWELSDVGTQEQQVLLTREPPLQPSRNRIESKTNCG